MSNDPSEPEETNPSEPVMQGDTDPAVFAPADDAANTAETVDTTDTPSTAGTADMTDSATDHAPLRHAAPSDIPPQPDGGSRLFLYSTAVSDVGTVRSNNQDSAFAGTHLISVCDGMGGHAGGDTASTIAIRGLSHIEQNPLDSSVQSIASMMETSVLAAHDAIVGKAKHERKLAGMGTTVTAVTLVRNHWICAHIGDSRAYLLRDGQLQRMTQDHSYVQHLIDTGRITESEARNHPQRNVVMRVLGDFDIDPHPDMAMFKARPGDRWLLCSDGLCGVLEDTTIEDVMTSVSDPEECAQRLVAMSLKAGSTDNVTAVIADATLALDAQPFDLLRQTPLIGGAAASNLEAIADIIKEPVANAPALRMGKTSPAQRAAALSRGESSGPADSHGETEPGANAAGTPEGDSGKDPQSGTFSPKSGTPEPQGDAATKQHVAQPSSVREETGEKVDMDTGEIPVIRKSDGRLTADPNDPDVSRAIRHEQRREKQAKRKHRNHVRLYSITAIVVVVIALLLASFGAWRWSQTKYYLGESDGVVAIYQGVNTNMFGVSLSHKLEDTDIKVSNLPQSWSEQLGTGIMADSLPDAQSRVSYIKSEIKTLKVHKDKDGKTVQTPDADESPSDSSSSKTSGKNSDSDAKSKSGKSAPASVSKATDRKGAGS